jgi:hypothetical protein
MMSNRLTLVQYSVEKINIYVCIFSIKFSALSNFYSHGHSNKAQLTPHSFARFTLATGRIVMKLTFFAYCNESSTFLHIKS